MMFACPIYAAEIFCLKHNNLHYEVYLDTAYLSLGEFI